MIRIRKISNPFLENNIKKIEEVKAIIKAQFPAIAEEKASEFVVQLSNPLAYQSLTSLFVAEDIHDKLRGFALLMYMPDLNFCFLDFIAVTPGKSSSGVGGALYQRIRDEARSLNVDGIFFECLPDNPDLCANKSCLEQNRKRLAFYERFGARPLINTKYETNVNPEDDCPPYLVFDGLDKDVNIGRTTAQNIIVAILKRKYRNYCDDNYIDMVRNSVQDDPIRLRPFVYEKKPDRPLSSEVPAKNNIIIFINEKHQIHHIKERGYVESPVRVSKIKKELSKTDLFAEGEVKAYPEKFILQVHDKGYFDYFKKVCKNISPGKSVYPYVFPIRNAVRAPIELSVRAGYYCFDTFTPINQNAFLAAKQGVNCVLSAADELIAGKPAAYVLTRPPGHHAESNAFGGFCYFNNVAIAAERLSKIGKIAILDIDYHHGNGQQQIFYERSDVLTISIHGHPSFAYPYFSGFEDEKGVGKGAGYNVNFPLPETISYDVYLKALSKSLNLIQKFKPEFLIIALGLDTTKNDPTGTWNFTYKELFNTGKLIGDLKYPTLIVQEGGYNTHSLGIFARYFFNGFYQNMLSK